MAIPGAGTFDYGAVIGPEAITDSEINLEGQSQRPSDVDSLVGHRPRIRFWHDLMVLIASQRGGASLKMASFAVGDAVLTVAQPSDVVYTKRLATGDVALSVLRDGQLVLALGAVSAVPLNPVMKETRFRSMTDEVRDHVEFAVGGERQRLRQQESTRLGDFDIYLEHPWQRETCNGRQGWSEGQG